jgi:hypothetical protein
MSAAARAAGTPVLAAWAAGAAWLAALACSGGSGGRATVPALPTPPPEAAPVAAPSIDAGVVEPAYESLDMGFADNVIPGLKVGADRAGCGLVAEQAQRLAVTCPEGVIFIQQAGRELRWACQTLAAEPCRALLMKLIEAGKGATGG